jgi:hypothetical protein
MALKYTNNNVHSEARIGIFGMQNVYHLAILVPSAPSSKFFHCQNLNEGCIEINLSEK